jgi:acyl-CoA thioesterase-2
MSGQFLRAGATAKPVEYQVDAVRDGRRYAARRVVAWQDDKPIFEMLCSFHNPEEGPFHVHAERPDIAPPESLVSVKHFMHANAHRLPPLMVETHGRAFPIELRLPDPEGVFFTRETTPVRTYWFRIPSAANIENPQDQQALLAFLSDFYFAGTAGALHFTPGDSMKLAVVTLNHSIWFHAPVKTGEWLMFHTDSPWAGHGRGLVRGMIFDRASTLAANVVQEISMRGV